MYEYKAIVTNVVDGDTIDLSIDVGFKITTHQRVRLARIDTPERAQANYQTAKDFVKNAVLNKSVTIKTEKVSKWGYYLAEVITETGQDIAQVLISQNLGRKYEGGSK